MADWTSVFIVFWVLWLADGVRFAPSEVFSVIGVGRRGVVRHDRWHWPHVWPAGWRVTVEDIPFTFSPDGISNRAAGTMGRPTEQPARGRAWRWSEVQKVHAEKGWLWINGGKFCRDTGHLTVREILALASLAPADRERQLARHLDRWLRPAHLRRKRRVLVARTATIAALNLCFLGLAVAVTGYVAGDFSARLPALWAGLIGRALPFWIGYLALLHFGAVVSAWLVLKKLKATRADTRGTALFSALMLPPQAMRLRALVGEAFFPAQHPLAYAVALARREQIAEEAFNVVADLRWPVGAANDDPLTQEIAAWYRTQLERRVVPMLASAGVDARELLAAPWADGAESCTYCPRCRSQFVAGHAHCARGVKLLPVRRAKP